MGSLGSYIGITGFSARAETERMLATFSRLDEGIPHVLGVGVMMSHETLHNLETKWSKAFPAKEQIASIFARHGLALNTLHYADYTELDVFNSLTRAIFWGGIDIDALHLDMIWPDPGVVANAVHASRKGIAVILQVGEKALEQASNDPSEVVRRLGDYEGVIDGVLLDKSMGQGRVMDAEWLLVFVRAIYETRFNVHVAVAGGLGPATIRAAEPIIREFPGISLAQAKLRPSGSALDPIDWEYATGYLKEATALLRKYQ